MTDYEKNKQIALLEALKSSLMANYSPENAKRLAIIENMLIQLRKDY